MPHFSAETEAPAARVGRGRPPAGRCKAELRERLLDVAEELFAQLGYEGVSTRHVGEQAGVTAPLLYYYFDSKRAIYEAVLLRRSDILSDERMIEFDAYEAAGAPSVEGAIAAYLRPVLNKLRDGGDGWRHYLTIIVNCARYRERGGDLLARGYDPVVKRLISMLGKALPMAQEADLYWAYHFLSGALMVTLCKIDRLDLLTKGQCRSTDVAAIEPRIIEFTAAGFRQLCAAKAP